MFRSFRRIGVLGACAAAAVAFAAAPAPAAADDGAYDFTLYAKELPDAGGHMSETPKVGESISFADDLYRTKGGEKVGRDGATCTVVRAGDQSDTHCVGVFLLTGHPGGLITAQTLAPISASAQEPLLDIAVTGGTGDFKGARGYIRSSADGDYEKLEFYLTR
ncbi:hypothetical protein AB0F11_16750 [Streptomyces sp. NPDC032472]|uniref:allene oxide cyclase barrel-like domain-containing protein n=1 Tax=Streptomyces sp. NPDC032472 TaxID=3155018 RepID=UPI0033D7135D